MSLWKVSPLWKWELLVTLSKDVIHSQGSLLVFYMRMAIWSSMHQCSRISWKSPQTHPGFRNAVWGFWNLLSAGLSRMPHLEASGAHCSGQSCTSLGEVSKVLIVPAAAKTTSLWQQHRAKLLQDRLGNLWKSNLTERDRVKFVEIL